MSNKIQVPQMTRGEWLWAAMISSGLLAGLCFILQCVNIVNYRYFYDPDSGVSGLKFGCSTACGLSAIILYYRLAQDVHLSLYKMAYKHGYTQGYNDSGGVVDLEFDDDSEYGGES